MHKINLYEAGAFSDQSFKRLLVNDSPYMKILNFNFKAGQHMAVHSHDLEGQVSMVILEGEGEFLGGGRTPARQEGRRAGLRHRRTPRPQGHHRPAPPRHHRPADLKGIYVLGGGPGSGGSLPSPQAPLPTL